MKFEFSLQHHPKHFYYDDQYDSKKIRLTTPFNEKWKMIKQFDSRTWVDRGRSMRAQYDQTVQVTFSVFRIFSSQITSLEYFSSHLYPIDVSNTIGESIAPLGVRS